MHATVRTGAAYPTTASRRGGFAFLLVLVISAASGCSAGDIELQALAPDARILAFGDSLTFGTGASAGRSYPAVLERLTGHKVINAGVPGELSAEGLRRLPRELEKHRPALVILCEGGNDFLRRHDKSLVERNLRAMISYLRGENVQVMLVGVPDFGIFLSTAELYGKIAGDMGVVLEDDILADVLGDNAFKSDRIHPNDAGYERMAGAIDAMLRARGAL